MIQASKIGARLFRNNTGTGWTGKVKASSNPNLKIIENARPLNAGLCVGSSDLIGWKTVEITQEMVGEKIAIFTAIEVKSKYSKASKEQINFLQQVKLCGGICGIAKTQDEAIQIINNSI